MEAYIQHLNNVHDFDSAIPLRRVARAHQRPLISFGRPYDASSTGLDNAAWGAPGCGVRGRRVSPWGPHGEAGSPCHDRNTLNVKTKYEGNVALKDTGCNRPQQRTATVANSPARDSQTRFRTHPHPGLPQPHRPSSHHPMLLV